MFASGICIKINIATTQGYLSLYPQRLLRNHYKGELDNSP